MVIQATAAHAGDRPGSLLGAWPYRQTADLIRPQILVWGRRVEGIGENKYDRRKEKNMNMKKKTYRMVRRNLKSENAYYLDMAPFNLPFAGYYEASEGLSRKD